MTPEEVRRVEALKLALEFYRRIEGLVESRNVIGTASHFEAYIVSGGR